MENNFVKSFRLVLRSVCGSTYWCDDERLNGDLTVRLGVMAAGKTSLEV
jgi:hypothetical protein